MTIKHKIIVGGAGGGGKGGGGGAGAVEAPNTLRSKQVAHIIDLLGEGEWEGLIDGPSGIYLNGVSLFTPTTPTNDVVDLDEVSDEDGVWTVPGVWNYKGVSVEFRHGTQTQTAIRAASSAASVQAVNLDVVHGTPITAAITNPNIDLAVVNVRVNQLYQQDTTNGNLSGYHVDLEIQARHGGGSWTSVILDRIEGKTMNGYVRSYSIDLHTINPTGPWDIKVIRTSADDPDSSKHSVITFQDVDLMSRDKFRYPNSVLAGIGIDASQLKSIPSRSYDCKMARIRVPINYNPTTRAYTGVWDGTFKIAWTDNPAWCLYDMITNSRYGLGEYIDDDLTDKWALYTIGQYCDELVSDGFGGTEPRFRLNVYFQSPAEAITLIQNMASVFRGILYYINESMTALQDAPSDAVYAFNSTNVADGVFSYAGASGSTRHTVAHVVWSNPEIQYKQDIETVEDKDGLVRFGYRPITVQAMGCTSRGQAHRMGLWALYVEQYEADVVTFTTALEGTGVQPGNVIDIYDELRASVRLGGRVIDQVAQSITLDKPVTLPVGTKTVYFIADDGSLTSRTTTNSGVLTAIAFTGTGVVPSIGSLFGIETATVQAQQFRIISISESDRHKYEITAVAYNQAKYAYVENGLTLTQRPTRAVRTPLAGVTNVEFLESLYLLADGSIRNRLTISWDQNVAALGYMVSLKIGSNNWSDLGMTAAPEITVSSAVEGWTYSVRIYTLTLDNVRGEMVETSYVVLGEKAPPPPFDVFTYSEQADGTHQIDYGYTVTEKPLDYLGAQIRVFLGVTTDWDAMTPLFDGFYTSSPLTFNGEVPAGDYTLAIKAEDRTHVLSDPVFIDVAVGDGRTPVAILEAIFSDNILSRNEKFWFKQQYDQFTQWKTSSAAQGTLRSLTTEVTNATNAYTTLTTYLQSLGAGPTEWYDTSVDTVIVGATLMADIVDTYNKLVILDTAIANYDKSHIDTAESVLNNIVSDNVLSKGEKPWLKNGYDQLTQWKTSSTAQGTARGLTTEVTNATNAYNTLTTYLQSLGSSSSDWYNVTLDTTIVGTTLSADVVDCYNKLVILDTAIANYDKTQLDSAAAIFANIISDNVLSKGEKPWFKQKYDDLTQWKVGSQSQATSLGITTESTAVTTSYNTLTTYLQSLGSSSSDWSNYTLDTTIVGATLTADILDLITKLNTLDTAIQTTQRLNTLSAQTTVNDYIAEAAADLLWLSADNLLQGTEKPLVEKIRQSILDYQTALAARITTSGLTISRTTFDTAVTALTTYLQAVYNSGTLQGVGTGTNDWKDPATDSILDRTTFLSKFKACSDAGLIIDVALNTVAATDPGDNLGQILNATATQLLTGINTQITESVTLGNDIINGIALDGVLSKNEKADLVTIKTLMNTWQTALAARRTAYAAASGLTAPSRTNLDNAMTALNTYLAAVYNSGTGQGVGTGTADWSTTTTDSTINGTVFANKFRAVFNAALILDNELSNYETAGHTNSLDIQVARATIDTRLKANGADILKAAVDVQTTGGIKAGTVTWDSTGTVTGGSGVVITAKGIVGVASGSTTFSIDSTTGAATFAGAITGGATISITGNARFEGSQTDTFGGSGLTAAVLSNTGRGANIGLIAYASRNTGAVGVIGYSNGSTGNQTVGVAGYANYTFDTGVYGEAAGSKYGVWGNNTAGVTGGAGVRATASAGATALLVTPASSSEIAVNITTGKFTWAAKSWVEPDGTVTKAFCANGNWLDLANNLRITAIGATTANGGTVALPAGALGFMTVDITGAGGTPVKIAYYTAP